MGERIKSDGVSSNIEKPVKEDPVKKVKVVKVVKKPGEGADDVKKVKKVKRVVRKVPKRTDGDVSEPWVTRGDMPGNNLKGKGELDVGVGGVDPDKDVRESEQDSSEGNKKRTGVGSFLTYLLELVMLSLFIILLTSVMNKYVVSFNIVSGSSMNPTLKDGDVCSVVKPRFSGELRRGDIVSFRMGEGSNTSIYVKRIIGLPGDRINVYDGVIHVNGEPLDEDYIQEGLKTDNPEKLYWELGLNEYFVLGDNRKPGMSHDSRHFGVVHLSMIEGKLGSIIYPFDRFERLHK